VPKASEINANRKQKVWTFFSSKGGIKCTDRHNWRQYSVTIERKLRWIISTFGTTGHVIVSAWNFIKPLTFSDEDRNLNLEI